jgi:predicted DNA-binding antitoxin AbrB/MazE fold protein
MIRARVSNGVLEPLEPLNLPDGVEVYLNLADAPEPSPEDIEASRSAAGAWADIDAERLIRDIYESRLISTRPVPLL